MTREKLLTIVVITHKFREVNAFCDTVTVLRRGRLSAPGPWRRSATTPWPR
jgi:simple sugar transport system ATP-binding protein